MSINGNHVYVSTDIDPIINKVFAYEEIGDGIFGCSIKPPSTHESYTFTEKSIEPICKPLAISGLSLQDIARDLACSADASSRRTIESYRLKTQILEEDNAKYRAIIDEYMLRTQTLEKDNAKYRARLDEYNILYR